MDASYQQLIDDHDRIIAAANLLLSRSDDPHCDAITLAKALHALSREVREHLATEDTIIASDHRLLSGPWLVTWQEGQAKVARLRQDWLAFLDAWGADSISQDRHAFALAAHLMLGRLRERVQTETQAFYAMALQSGAIRLR